MRWKGWRPPQPPEDVKMHCRDGSVIPVELRYDGKERGIHQWVNTFPLPLAELDHVTIRKLPGFTAVRLEARHEHLAS